MTGLPWSFHFERSPRKKIQWLSAMFGVTKWTDDVPFQPLMLIDHETYKPKPLFDVKPAPPYTVDPATYVEYKNGDGRTWRYRNILLPMGESLSTVTEERGIVEDEDGEGDYDGSVHGRAYFTGPVVFPGLTEVIGGSERIWMSITPMEIFTCRYGVKWATEESKKKEYRRRPPLRKVVIAGLGLGWVLQKMAAVKTVKEIVVVEQSEGLLDWYGRDMCNSVKKVTDVIVADYWEVAEKLGDSYFHMIDVWPLLGEAYRDEHLEEQFFSFGSDTSWWGWGYQFGEDEDSENVLDEDTAITRQMGYDEEDDDDDD